MSCTVQAEFRCGTDDTGRSGSPVPKVSAQAPDSLVTRGILKSMDL
ncbi:MAG: hypothetical protein ACFFE8_03670 [Candidatus Heimdallarchaeota archaeon]